MSRTFNSASFESTERITDELIAAFDDDWDYETEADRVAEAYFDAWMLRHQVD